MYAYTMPAKTAPAPTLSECVDCSFCGELMPRPKDRYGRFQGNSLAFTCKVCEETGWWERGPEDCLGCESGTDSGYHTCDLVTKTVVVS